MKKVLTLGFSLLASIAMMAGCSSAPKAEGKTAEGFLYQIKGTSHSNKIYYKTAADGKQSVKVKDGKYVIDSLPKRLTKYKVTLSNDEDFNNTSTITVPAAKPLGTVDDVLQAYDDTYNSEDSLSAAADLDGFGDEGYHQVTIEHGVKVSASVNDGHVMGIELYMPEPASTAGGNCLNATFFTLGYGMGGDLSSMEKLVLNTTKSKNDGDPLSIKTSGMTMQGIGIKGSLLIFRIYK